MTARQEVLQIDGPAYFGNSSHLASVALHHYRKGQVDQATSKFEQAVALEPNNGSLHNNLGLMYFEQRQLVAAANHFDEAIQLMPGDARPINGLAMTLEAGGRVMEAIELYNEASELAPDNPLYLGNSLRARTRMGERSDAMVEQLQHLAFIETRADWLAWTDEQLALYHNPTLDRGPAKTQFDSSKAKRNSQSASPPIVKPAELFEEVSPPELLSPELSPSEGYWGQGEHLPVPEPAPQ